MSAKTVTRKTRALPVKRASGKPPQASFKEVAFDEIVALIRSARQQAARVVNIELIDLYSRIGDYLHRKIESDGWAKGTVVQLAAYIAQREPGRCGSLRDRSIVPCSSGRCSARQNSQQR